MKLTEKQRKIVEMLGDELFNVQHIERYYKEDVPKSSSFDVFMFHKNNRHSVLTCGRLFFYVYNDFVICYAERLYHSDIYEKCQQ